MGRCYRAWSRPRSPLGGEAVTVHACTYTLDRRDCGRPTDESAGLGASVFFFIVRGQQLVMWLLAAVRPHMCGQLQLHVGSQLAQT